ncbi:FecR domain-containing protein [Xenophilus sp. Marseille-Q4582]|uniref:FecR domain-containing protein n=1 Tax=Xenophilus sp. Marseille-Q4582 TaxID=2866600 RepID=UPI001CE4477B|nr:FecR domain-containing protein [Xenophilus sp. Marseille-Q4582]
MSARPTSATSPARAAPSPLHTRLSVADATEAAVDWWVELRSGEVGPDMRVAFARWLAADERHVQAWAGLQASVGQVFDGGAAPERGQADWMDGLMNRAQRATQQRRRLLQGALALTGVGVGAGLMVSGSRVGWVPDVMADLRTGIGERQRFALDDGSSPLLDADSAVDVDFRARRWVRLRRGQLIVQVHPAGADAPPFVVESAHGQVQALGTRFLVRQDAHDSLALVLEHAVELRTPTAGAVAERLDEGQAARFDGQRIVREAADGPASFAAAWSRGMFEALDTSLGEVVAALRHYRRGLIRVAPEAARLRVTGAFPLDDVDAALTALAETMPIEVYRHAADWLVRIEPQR